MARLIRPPFDPRGPLVARTRIRLEGRMLEPGERVPESVQRDLTHSTLRGLWAQRKIECATSLEDVEDWIVADTASKLGVPPPPTDSTPPADPLPEGVTVEHVGGGWFRITRPGQEPFKVRGKKAAEAAARG